MMPLSGAWGKSGSDMSMHEGVDVPDEILA